MFVDPEGHFALSILLIGLLVGAAIGGGFEIANQVGSKGWNLGDWDWGKIVNHTLVGGAIGLAGAAGVVFLGPIIAGTAAVGAGKTALIALGVTTVISFVAGAGGYAIEESMNGRKVDFGNAIGHGSIVVLESIWSFGVGGIVGSIGKIGTKGPFLSKEWIWKLIFTQEFTQPFKIPMDLIRKYLF